MSETRSALRLTSPAFDDGERIPRRFGRDEEDVNPPLQFEGVPEDARSLALSMDDPDAKAVADKVWTHWIVYGIDPDRRSIPEDWDGGQASMGRNDFDETGYGGPSPPGGEHTYVFRLYALDDRPEMFDHPIADDFQRSIEGHVLSEDELRGTYPAEW